MSATDSFPQAFDPRRAQYISWLVAASFFMENLDATVITTAVPSMAESFGVLPVGLSIGISAYMLALAVFIPVSGWIADRFGPRQVFTAAVVVFTVASVACGLSANLPMFVVARILQGIGGALMVPVGRLVVMRSTSKENLVQAMATITWPGLAAPVLGPPLGGWITSTWSWHWIFFLNVPLGMLAIVFALRLIEDAPPTIKPFDWTGFFASGIGLGTAMYGLDLMSHPVIDWPVATACVGVGLFALGYAVWHLLRAEHPLINLSAMGLESFRVSQYGGSLFRTVVGATPFLMPLMFQLAYGFSMVKSGFMMLALFAGNLAIKPATTHIIRTFGFRTTLIGNGLLVALGFVAYALVTPDTPMPVLLALMVVTGMCRSMQFSAFNVLAFADTTPAQTSGATTLFSMTQQLCAGVGIAFGAIALSAAERLTGRVGQPGIPEFRMALVACVVLALLAIVDSWMLPRDVGQRVSGHRMPAPAK